ncbi:Ankyrin repeat and sterile alpha motif domain-containing protein 1B [Bagarius yarrelli]|uniref:Ankyrin repeat and sterile alpha motif domain-containing protein 1B n=1 Tax=Bagarius yarrelli TaxID=175774 RepID=A0A556TI82_BAGYA|nr:Ankyrin repeat and sterile alpha motif domain-containing protein 1B [Bagarius yarrelli]
MGKEHELLEAARTGNVLLVEKLLSGKRGLLGSSSGSMALPGLLRDVVLKLLQYEASTNVPDNKGCFPLHLAAWRGDVDIVRILMHHGPSHCRVNEQNHEKETALHCAAQYGHSEVVCVLLQELTDPSMRNRRGETPLDLAALYGRLQVVRMLLNAHPNLMSLNTRQHTPLHLAARNGHHSTVQALLEAGMDVNTEEIKHSQCPVDLSDMVLMDVDETVTGELSKLLNDIKMCRDRDYSFEELCQAISSHSQSMESFCSGTLSDDDRNTSHNHATKWPTPPLPSAIEEEEKTCGPSGLWEALTPCNGCRNLGFSQDSKHCVEIIQSSSLEVFSPEEEDNPYESVTTAVTRKPCSLDIHLINACPRNGQLIHIITYYITPKQRTSLSSSQDVQRPVPNHSGEPSEVSSSLGYASFSTSPPASPLISPANYSIGSAEDCPLTGEARMRVIRTLSVVVTLPAGGDGRRVYATVPSSRQISCLHKSGVSGVKHVPDDGLYEVVEQRETALKDSRRESRVPEQFAGLLHGSSPACEFPDNPYQLYSKVHKDPPQRHGNLLLAPDHAVPFPAPKIPKEPKPQIVYRTIFHTRVNQSPSAQGKSEDAGNHSAGGYEERACTLGRMRTGMSKNVPELQLSRSLSKSDSNLVVASPIEEEKRNSRGQNSPTRLERTPSFTAEWEEIDKIMSSIGAGIGTELQENDEDHTAGRSFCDVTMVTVSSVRVRKAETGSLPLVRREVPLRAVWRESHQHLTY